MDTKTEFFVKLSIAVAVGIGLAAIVYSRNDAVIYFWGCTYAIRVCILINAIIFFFASTIVTCGILYVPNLVGSVFLNKNKNTHRVVQAPKVVFTPEPKQERGSARLFVVNNGNGDLFESYATLGKLLTKSNWDWSEEYKHLYGYTFEFYPDKKETVIRNGTRELLTVAGITVNDRSRRVIYLGLNGSMFHITKDVNTNAYIEIRLKAKVFEKKGTLVPIEDCVFKGFIIFEKQGVYIEEGELDI